MIPRKEAVMMDDNQYLQAQYSDYFTEFPDVVNVAQMCQMLGGIGKDTGYRLLKENKIEHFKIGRCYRIAKRSILKYLGIL